MPADTEKDCAVCTKKMSQRCSGCKNVFFCSSNCQAVIWKSHKHFCKDPAPTSFTFPALSAEEAATFAVSHTHLHCPIILNLPTKTRMYWDEYMAKRGWYEGEPATLLKELQKKKGCAVPEPQRSYIIATMGQYLYYSCAQPHIPEPPNSQWHMTGHDVLVFMQELEKDRISIPAYTFTRLAPFWTQLLLWHTISLNPKARETDRLLAASRLLGLMKADDLKLPDAVFQALWQVARAANKESAQTSMASLLSHLTGGGLGP
ncbi:hypothetical protein JCM6882_002696 [Rhodosporidiobolus microsporus]